MNIEALVEMACTKMVIHVTPHSTYEDLDVLNSLITACTLKRSIWSDPDLQDVSQHTTHGIKALDKYVGYSFLGLPPGMVLQKSIQTAWPNDEAEGTYLTVSPVWSGVPRFAVMAFNEPGTGGTDVVGVLAHHVRDLLEEGLCSSGDRMLTYLVSGSVADFSGTRDERRTVAAGGQFRNDFSADVYGEDPVTVDAQYFNTFDMKRIFTLALHPQEVNHNSTTDNKVTVYGVQAAYGTCPSASGAYTHVVKKGDYTVDQFRGVPQARVNLNGSGVQKGRCHFTMVSYFFGRTNNPQSSVYKPNMPNYLGKPSGMFVGDLFFRPTSCGANGR